MRTMSFNVNGIRSRLNQLEIILEKHSPTIVGLQEIKVSNEEFPIQAITEMGYEVSYFGQKGHYGVALLSKTSPVNVIKGFPTDDNESQKRIIHGHYQYGSATIHVINGYFPQGENRSHPTKFPAKEKFYSDLGMYMRDNFKQNDYVVVMGDMNVAPKNIDVGIGPDNMKRWLQRGICCFLPEERTWLDSIMSFPLFDTYRHLHCNDLEYSWFDYRSRGFDQDPKRGLRIDLILSSQSLLPRMIDAGIDVEARGLEKPSDHCPVWADFELS
ncbi:MAG: exodeoxyribonuclease III [SAR92 clade bacterium]|uniref:Exodeoxyribonuclease III n=1 Tax=SAR92 clade bacterium TaxID=2315479 RepID=A0A520LNB7_9GAMM|nr:MAG: exodeoxyribonuclease III [SAR92 clade bacterium]